MQLWWWARGNGARRGLVTIVELIYTVMHMSDRLLTQANPNPRLTPPPDLRSGSVGWVQ